MKSVSYLSLFCLAIFLKCSLAGEAFCAKQPIIAFGDSLTEGCGNKFLDSCGVKCPLGKDCYDYVDTVESLLADNNHNLMVNNFGLGGEYTTEAVNRLGSVLNNQCNENAQYILILEGTNDLNIQTSPYTIKFNLDVMIEKSMAKGLIPLVATIPPDITPGYEFKEISATNRLIQDLVSQKASQGKEIFLVDLYNALQSNWRSYTNPQGCYPDRLHPNSSGYSAMGSVWYASLSGLFPPKTLTWLQLLLSGP